MFGISRILSLVFCILFASLANSQTQPDPSDANANKVEVHEADYIYLPAEIPEDATSIGEDGSLMIERGAGCPPSGPFGASAAICNAVCKAKKGYSGGYCAGPGEKTCKCHK